MKPDAIIIKGEYYAYVPPLGARTAGCKGCDLQARCEKTSGGAFCTMFRRKWYGWQFRRAEQTECRAMEIDGAKRTYRNGCE